MRLLKIAFEDAFESLESKGIKYPGFLGVVSFEDDPFYEKLNAFFDSFYVYFPVQYNGVLKDYSRFEFVTLFSSNGEDLPAELLSRYVLFHFLDHGANCYFFDHRLEIKESFEFLNKAALK